MSQRALILLIALAVALALPVSALAGTAGTRVIVAPRVIGPHTTVLLRFRQPVSTGTTAAGRSYDALMISGPARRGCIGARRVVLPAARRGTLIRHALRPRRLGGRWCTGTYRGWVTYQDQAGCRNPGPTRPLPCPMYLVAPRTLATFRFRVTTP
jgi:hypothetical protein